MHDIVGQARANHNSVLCVYGCVYDICSLNQSAVHVVEDTNKSVDCRFPGANPYGISHAIVSLDH